MTDRRTDPDPRIAKSQAPGQIVTACADLRASPNGPRDRQLLLGETVTILGSDQGYSYVRTAKDGYIGYVSSNAIAPPEPHTHTVTAAATHVYAEPSIKSPDRMVLSFGARISALNETRDFVETRHGHIPKQALTACPVPNQDPIATARLFLGTPYLWGGNSRAGIDCSGLVQAALLAAGIPCPGDSDQQERMLGAPSPDNSYQPGDLLFWRGHVALVTTPQHMIHANAHHMCVAEEQITPAIHRIAKAGDGPVTAHIRS